MNGRMIAALVVGMVVGGALLFLYCGKELNSLYAALEEARLDNQHLLEETTSLKKQILDHKTNVPRVQLIKVNVITDDEFTKATVVRYVKTLTSSLVDRPVADIEHSPDLITSVLDGRTIQVNDAEWTLHVNSVVLSQIVWITVSLTAAASGS